MGVSVSKGFKMMCFALLLLLKGPCHEIFDLWFFAYSFYPKALIVGLKRFLKKYEFEKLFGYKVVRSIIGLLRKIFVVSLDPQIFCLLMTNPGHIRLFIYFFLLQNYIFFKKKFDQNIENFSE